MSTYIVASVLFPPPYAVLLRPIELLQDGVLVENVGASLHRIVIGFIRRIAHRHPDRAGHRQLSAGPEDPGTMDRIPALHPFRRR